MIRQRKAAVYGIIIIKDNPTTPLIPDMVKFLEWN